MTHAPRLLEEPYRTRALPPGSARYFSWVFASPGLRAPLAGLYALMAELRALADPATEATAAQLKLAWWQEEIGRLASGVPVHPIGHYLIALPRAAQVDFAPLGEAAAAILREIAGAPLERGADLAAHAAALAAPFLVAAQFEISDGKDSSVQGAATALAGAEYLQHALDGYRREALAGRVVFPVDELLAAGIENQDLSAARPPVQLQSYLEELRRRARAAFAAADQALPDDERARQRHLLVLAALGARRLQGRAGRGWRDLFVAWSVARRGARGAGAEHR